MKKTNWIFTMRTKRMRHFINETIFVSQFQLLSIPMGGKVCRWLCICINSNSRFTFSYSFRFFYFFVAFLPSIFLYVPCHCGWNDGAAVAVKFSVIFFFSRSRRSATTTPCFAHSSFKILFFSSLSASRMACRCHYYYYYYSIYPSILLSFSNAFTVCCSHFYFS